MYKIIGVDGKVYGPVSLEQLKEWIAQGRVNERSLIQPNGSAEWKPARDIVEIQPLLKPGVPASTLPSAALPPPIGAVAPSPAPKQGLAIASFVLGIVSFVLCLGVLTGVPAILCGYAAKNRVRLSPREYGGAGLAMAGLILGFLSVVYTILIVAMLVPVFGNSRKHAQLTMCSSNMRQIGLALRVWGLDHHGQFPFNVSTNDGGTQELCRTGVDGFDSNAPRHLAVIGKELGKTAVLICPSDASKQPGSGFSNLQPQNVTYLLRTGSDVTDTNLSEILLKCPLHGTLLRCDGSVEAKTQGRRVRW